MDEIKEYDYICPQECQGDMEPRIISCFKGKGGFFKKEDVDIIIAERDAAVYEWAKARDERDELKIFREIAKDEKNYNDILRDLLTSIRYSPNVEIEVFKEEIDAKLMQKNNEK